MYQKSGSMNSFGDQKFGDNTYLQENEQEHKKEFLQYKLAINDNSDF